MNRFRRFLLILIIVEAIIIGVANLVYFNYTSKEIPKISRSEESGQTSYIVTYNNRDDNFNLILLNSALGTMAAISIIASVFAKCNKLLHPPGRSIYGKSKIDRLFLQGMRL